MCECPLTTRTIGTTRPHYRQALPRIVSPVFVLRDADRAEVARFKEKDVVGIRKGRRIDVSAKHDWDW